MLTGVIQAILSAFCFGMLAILGKLAYGRGFATFEILQYRFGFAALMLFVYILATQRHILRANPRTLVKAVVLDVDVEKERISLGIKQVEKGGASAVASASGLNKNAVVTVTVVAIKDGGLDVQVGDDGAIGFIKRADLGRDRDEQRPDRFQVGQKFDAMVTGFDRSKNPTFSVKAMQIAEEKQAVAQYGSSDSGASLGDILGEALKARDTKK